MSQSLSVPLTLTLSPTLSEKVQQLAESQQQDVLQVVETILDEAFYARQPKHKKRIKTQRDLAFEQEVHAFERLKPELLERYPGRVVAIYQGQVIAVGDKRMDVLGEVWKQFGEIPCYIETVVAETPRRVRIPVG